MAGGQHEPVAADPPVVVRVGLHDLLVEQIGNRRQRDRGARVPVADFLHRVGGQNARGVNCTPVFIGPGQIGHIVSFAEYVLGLELRIWESSPECSGGDTEWIVVWEDPRRAVGWFTADP